MLKKINGEIQKLRVKTFPRGRLLETKMSLNFLPHLDDFAALTYLMQTVPRYYLDGQPCRRPHSRLVGMTKKIKSQGGSFYFVAIISIRLILVSASLSHLTGGSALLYIISLAMEKKPMISFSPSVSE